MEKLTWETQKKQNKINKLEMLFEKGGWISSLIYDLNFL